MASVRLQDLVKEFEGATGSPAVAGVSMDIRDGEFVVLVGPSGCGKTTVLRMIAGLEVPTRGSIFIGAEDVTDLSPRERDVAMVFQNYALYPHMTVRENIRFPLRMRKVAAAESERRVKDVAEMLGIGEYLDRQPAQLSGGQRQRVALARAIVREPAVFLFDEPLSNLDAQIRATTRAELVRLHRSLGATMIYVTHDQVEALSMAQRVGLMRAGRVEQFAPPLEVYRSPATLFTASFIGSPAVNALSGRIDSSAPGRHVFSGALQIPVSASPAPQATLVFRPEQVRLASGDGIVRGEVILTEALGAESVIHVRLSSGEDIRVRHFGVETPVVGASVGLEIDTVKALIYDAAGRLAGRGQ